MHGGWILAAGFVAVAMVIVSGHLPPQPSEGDRPGLTSAVTLLVMFALGAYLMAGSKGVAIALGGAVVVLLHLKPQMHALGGKSKTEILGPSFSSSSGPQTSSGTGASGKSNNVDCEVR
jgi:uncharacterized membrane protein (DUF4010 family)